MQLDNASSWSLRHRAYALALAGMHQFALNDLAAARAGSTDEAIPAWEPIVEAYCRYDSQILANCDPREARELAALVSYLIVEDSNSPREALPAAERSLAVIPECYSVSDSMARYGGVINLHTATTQGPRVLRQTLNGRLRAIDDLPRNVAAAVARSEADEAPVVDPALLGGPARAEIIESLCEAGSPERDSMEPSWEVLGRLLEDVTFVHAYRRIAFFYSPLGLAHDDYETQLTAACQMLAKHPMAAR